MQQVSRQSARAGGMTYYFTGKPCVHGHVSKRLVSNGRCYTCASIDRNEWRKNNPVRSSEALNRWRLENPERIAAHHRAYYSRKRDKALAYARANRHKRSAAQRLREARRRDATPPWLSKEELIRIEADYLFARLKYRLTGIKHHVDHIVPLRGKNVCGLHVPWNLQVITAHENNRKYNKF